MNMDMNHRNLQTFVLLVVLVLPTVQMFTFRAALRNLKNKTDDLISNMEKNELNCTSFRKGQTNECLMNLENITFTTNKDICDVFKTFYNHFTEASNLKTVDMSDHLHPVRQSMKDLQRKKCKSESSGDTCRFTEATDGDYEKFCKVFGLVQTFREHLENLLERPLH